jgi:hypothetical protein
MIRFRRSSLNAARSFHATQRATPLEEVARTLPVSFPLPDVAILDRDYALGFIERK